MGSAMQGLCTLGPRPPRFRQGGARKTCWGQELPGNMCLLLTPHYRVGPRPWSYHHQDFPGPASWCTSHHALSVSLWSSSFCELLTLHRNRNLGDGWEVEASGSGWAWSEGCDQGCPCSGWGAFPQHQGSVADLGGHGHTQEDPLMGWVAAPT